MSLKDSQKVPFFTFTTQQVSVVSGLSKISRIEMTWNSAPPKTELKSSKRCLWYFFSLENDNKSSWVNYRESKLCFDDPVPIRKLRAANGSIEAFDKSLESLINLYTRQPSIDYPDGESIASEMNSLKLICCSSQYGLEEIPSNVCCCRRIVCLHSDIHCLSSTITRRALRRQRDVCWASNGTSVGKRVDNRFLFIKLMFSH